MKQDILGYIIFCFRLYFILVCWFGFDLLNIFNLSWEVYKLIFFYWKGEIVLVTVLRTLWYHSIISTRFFMYGIVIFSAMVFVYHYPCTPSELGIIYWLDVASVLLLFLKKPETPIPILDVMCQHSSDDENYVLPDYSDEEDQDEHEKEEEEESEADEDYRWMRTSWWWRKKLHLELSMKQAIVRRHKMKTILGRFQIVIKFIWINKKVFLREIFEMATTVAVGVVVVAPVSILIAVSFKYVNFHYFRLNDVDFMGCLLILMVLGWGLTLICLILVDVWLGCGWLDLTKPKLQCRTEEGFFVDYQYDYILNTLMNKEIHLAN